MHMSGCCERATVVPQAPRHSGIPIHAKALCRINASTTSVPTTSSVASNTEAAPHTLLLGVVLNVERAWTTPDQTLPSEISA